jgi:hypothetical protein
LGVIRHVEEPPLDGSTKDEEDDRAPKLVAMLQISLNILSFETEGTHSSRFSYSSSEVLRTPWDDIDLTVARTADQYIHACRILSHSSAPLRKLEKQYLLFILMAQSSSGLFIISLNDTKVKANEETGVNVLSGRYKYNKGKILNLMPINRITEHHAEHVTLGQMHVKARRQASPEIERIPTVWYDCSGEPIERKWNAQRREYPTTPPNTFEGNSDCKTSTSIFYCMTSLRQVETDAHSTSSPPPLEGKGIHR